MTPDYITDYYNKHVLNNNQAPAYSATAETIDEEQSNSNKPKSNSLLLSNVNYSLYNPLLLSNVKYDLYNPLSLSNAKYTLNDPKTLPLIHRVSLSTEEITPLCPNVWKHVLQQPELRP